MWSKRVLVAAFAFVLAYAWWTLNQYERLNDLNQRELSAAARVLEATVENAAGIVRNRRGPSTAEEIARDSPYLGLQVPSSCHASGDEIPSSGGVDGNERADQDEDPRVVANGGLLITAGSSTSACFRFLTDALFQELSFPESFGLILLASHEGRVLYQDTPAPRRRLRFLRRSEREFTSVDGGGPRFGNLATFWGDTTLSPSWTQFASASGRIRIQLGGAWYQLYVEPVTLDGAATPGLVLGGLVKTSDVVRQAFAVDTYFVAALVGLGLLGVLGLPFIKLASLHRQERFRPRDVLFLYVSTGALLSLLTFAVMTADAYVRWRAVADVGLQTFAVDLDRTLTNEVADIRARLRRLDGAAARRTPPLQCARDGRTTLTRDQEDAIVAAWLSEASLPGWLTEAGGQDVFTRATADLYLEQAAWVAPNGMQTWKITAARFASQVNVSGREYFRAVRDAMLYDEARDGGFFLVPLRSITDGAFYTFVSLRSDVDASKCEPGAANARSDPYVAVATVRLLSLNQVPLPAGYGFAVISRDGSVLYHSDPRLSRRENLFDELSQGRQTRSAVFSSREHLMSSRYRERPSRVLVRPLSLFALSGDASPRSALHLVVFRDVSMEGSVVARAFVAALAGPMTLLLGFFVAIVSLARWASARWGHDARRWLWPSPDLTSFYRRLVWCWGIIVALGLGSVLDGRSGWVVFLPFAAILAAGVVFALTDWRHPARPRSTAYAMPYTVAVWLFFICLFVLPASASFRSIIGHEFATIVSTEQRWVNEQKRDVGLTLEAEAREQEFLDLVGRELATARQERLVSNPAPYDVSLQPTRRFAQPLLTFHEWFDDFFPLGDEIVSRQRYEVSDSEYHPPGRARQFSWGALLAMVGITALLLAWVRWCVDRLFLAGVDTTSEPSAASGIPEAWHTATNDEQYAIMQIVRDGLANPHQYETVRRFLENGLLRRAPELRAGSDALETLVRQRLQEPSDAERLRQWETITDEHGWRHVRTVVLVSVVGLVLFLVVTQPALQSELTGIASAATALAALGVRLRQSIRDWLSTRAAPSD